MLSWTVVSPPLQVLFMGSRGVTPETVRFERGPRGSNPHRSSLRAGALPFKLGPRRGGSGGQRERAWVVAEHEFPMDLHPALAVVPPNDVAGDGRRTQAPVGVDDDSSPPWVRL